MRSGEFKHRLHLICGDSVRSDLSEYLKVGTTALVLLWLQHKPNAADDLKKACPVRFMRNANVLWHPTGRLGNFKPAVELQRNYCDRVGRFVHGQSHLPDWCGEVG